MCKLHLSDVIDYERDIAPYRLIEIHAGPGAGKNTMMEAFAKGEYPNAPKMRVLLITSRRAKVDETFTTYENPDQEALSLFKQKIGVAWDVTDPQGQSSLATVGNTVCTSAFIEGYLRQVFQKDNPRTHLWDLYDIIAVDEVHSLILDANYQSAPFYVYDLINHYLERCVSDRYPDPVCKHLILMTATPDPLRNYFPVAEVSWNVLDKTQECVNVQPKTVGFLEKKNVIDHLANLIDEGKRCIYFGNSIERIKEIFTDKALPIDRMVLSFSKEEKRELLEAEDPEAYDNMLEAEERIKSDYQIPEQFDILLTTSRYREGINIKDDINEMIIETHNRSEAIQMAGRVRSSVESLYIVVNAQPHPIDYVEERLEQRLARIQLNGSTIQNEAPIYDSHGDLDRRCYPLAYMLYETSTRERQQLIDLAERKFPYIRYSYIYSTFMFYEPRRDAIKYIQKQDYIWKKGIRSRSLHKIVQEWFPSAEVSEFKSERDKKYEASWALWKKYGFRLDTIYKKDVIESFRTELSFIWNYKQLKKLLSMFSHYEYVRAGKGNKGYKFKDTHLNSESTVF